LEFVLGGRRALEHPAIKYKGLAEGEAFVSNLRRLSGAFFFGYAKRAGPGIRLKCWFSVDLSPLRHDV
ncbi:hypothetical protein RSP799_01250, partial [Ralstonia solanacearum]